VGAVTETIDLDALPSLSTPVGRTGTEGTKRLAKRLAFLVGVCVLGGAVGAGSFMAATALQLPGYRGLERWASSPYVPVVVFAALARAALVVWHRPDCSRRNHGYVDELVEALRQGTLGTLAIVVFTFFWRGGTQFRSFSYSRAVFLIDWVLATVGIALLLILTKVVLAQLRRRGHDQRALVIVGRSRTAASFVEHIGNHPETGYQVVASIDDGVDFVNELVRMVERRPVDDVVLVNPSIERRDIERLVGVSELRHIEVRAVPELFGLPPAKIALSPAGEFPLLSLLNDPLPGSRRSVNRALDLIGGSLTLAVLSPLMLLVALAVRVTSPGPVFFRQMRVGMDGRPFMLLKFRTMSHNAATRVHEAYVTSFIHGEAAQVNDGLYKLVDDPRVTRVGRWLRRFSLDELPQLFNVIKGDMSLVGPRPALAFEVALYKEWHRRRLDVRPGMTGLWQVSGRNRMTFDEMAQLDLQYIENWSPLLYLTILGRTVPAVLRKEAG
jgi:exopolysaccharide biosynthesis polyprenyl glycosylphosphotransferase